MLFSLQVVVFSHFLFCGWLMVHAVWSEKVLEIISALWSVLRLVLCPSLCSGECSLCAWRECVFWCLDAISWTPQSSLTGLFVPFTISAVLLLLWKICPLVSVGCKVSYCCIPIHFSFTSAGIVLCIGCSCFRRIYVDECEILLWWFFYQYLVSFFIFLYGLSFEVYFVWYEYCDFCFLVMYIRVEYLFHSLSLNLCMPFVLRSVSYRQHISSSSFFI